MVVIAIPNAKQLSPSHVVSEGRELLGSAVPGDERDGIGVTLKQSPRRHASEADLSQTVGQQYSAERFVAELPRQQSRQKPRFVQRRDVGYGKCVIAIIRAGARERVVGDVTGCAPQLVARRRRRCRK
jgi:hypothetical protein